MDHHIAAGIMAQSRNTHSRYPATSSAFSASAHPHEDWTKISDLAERRRIQNRIAQRNYRKKLKKRLEDLERKAASTSPSPEQQCIQLSQQKSPVRKKVALASTPGSLSTSPQKPSSRSPQPSHQHSLSGMIPLPDSALFSDCFSRQISNSPPPVLSYPIATSGAFDFSPFTSTMEYPTATATYNPMGYSFNPYPTTSYTGTPIASYPTKTDFYPDIDANTFTFQYAATPVTNIDNNSYTESMPQTPPLSDCHDLYGAGGSPSDSSFLPQTPPMAYETSPSFTMV